MVLYACKKCNRLIKTKKCNICNSADVTEKWKGRVIIINTEKSEIAKKMEITFPGQYALKVK